MRTQLHIFPTFANGGAQRRLLQLANGMATDWRHHIIALDGDHGAAAGLGANVQVELDTVSLEKSGGLSVGNIRALRQRIADIDPDILCTYNWGTIEAGLANRLGSRLPHLHFEDGFGLDESHGTLPRRNLFRRLALSGRSTVVVPSRGLYQTAQAKWGVPSARLRHMLNAVDTDRFAPADPPVSDRSIPVIGTVGALRAEKNMGRLLQCVAAMSVPVRLVIVGEGSERAALEDHAQQLGMTNVDFVGNLDDPSTAYHRFDVFALSSNTEQMPLTVLEAMASGLAVVSTDVGDVAGMVSDANRPFITTLGDDAAFTAALTDLVTSPTILTEMGNANRERALRTYGETGMVAAYRALFDQLTLQR